MLTAARLDEICEQVDSSIKPATRYDYMRAAAKAAESAVRAEYADVPPEKWKALYRACALRQRGFEGLSGELYYAMKAIDNGTYNPKIGGEA